MISRARVFLKNAKSFFYKNSFAKGKKFKIYEGEMHILFFHFYPYKKMYLYLKLPLQF